MADFGKLVVNEALELGKSLTPRPRPDQTDVAEQLRDLQLSENVQHDLSLVLKPLGFVIVPAEAQTRPYFKARTYTLISGKGRNRCLLSIPNRFIERPGETEMVLLQALAEYFQSGTFVLLFSPDSNVCHLHVDSILETAWRKGRRLQVRFVPWVQLTELNKLENADERKNYVVVLLDLGDSANGAELLTPVNSDDKALLRTILAEQQKFVSQDARDVMLNFVRPPDFPIQFDLSGAPRAAAERVIDTLLNEPLTKGDKRLEMLKNICKDIVATPELQQRRKIDLEMLMQRWAYLWE